MKPSAFITSPIHAMVQETSTQYNDSSIFYSSSTQVYGGLGAASPANSAPNNTFALSIKPNSIGVN